MRNQKPQSLYTLHRVLATIISGIIHIIPDINKFGISYYFIYLKLCVWPWPCIQICKLIWDTASGVGHSPQWSYQVSLRSLKLFKSSDPYTTSWVTIFILIYFTQTFQPVVVNNNSYTKYNSNILECIQTESLDTQNNLGKVPFLSK